MRGIYGLARLQYMYGISCKRPACTPTQNFTIMDFHSNILPGHIRIIETKRYLPCHNSLSSGGSLVWTSLAHARIPSQHECERMPSAIGTLHVTQCSHPLVERDMLRLCCGKLLHLSCKSIAKTEWSPIFSVASRLRSTV